MNRFGRSGTRSRGRTFGAAVLVWTIALLALGCGPIGPFSGGRLKGEERSWPPDWKRVAEMEEIQLETGPEDPYSVNLWVVVDDEQAYVASSLLAGTEEPEERRWVRNVVADPQVRMRVDGAVYPARIETVSDAAVVSRVFDAFVAKYPQLETTRGAGARYFRIGGR